MILYISGISTVRERETHMVANFIDFTRDNPGQTMMEHLLTAANNPSNIYCGNVFIATVPNRVDPIAPIAKFL